MFSKIAKLTILIPLLAPFFLLVGCDKFLKDHSGDDKNSPQALNISFQSVECLKAAPKQLQGFFNDEASPAGLATAFNCIQGSLKEFQRLTRGAQAQGYQGKEIQFR